MKSQERNWTSCTPSGNSVLAVCAVDRCSSSGIPLSTDCGAGRYPSSDTPLSTGCGAGCWQLNFVWRENFPKDEVCPRLVVSLEQQVLLADHWHWGSDLRHGFYFRFSSSILGLLRARRLCCHCCCIDHDGNLVNLNGSIYTENFLQNVFIFLERMIHCKLHHIPSFCAMPLIFELTRELVHHIPVCRPNFIPFAAYQAAGCLPCQGKQFEERSLSLL